MEDKRSCRKPENYRVCRLFLMSRLKNYAKINVAKGLCFPPSSKKNLKTILRIPHRTELFFTIIIPVWPCKIKPRLRQRTHIIMYEVSIFRLKVASALKFRELSIKNKVIALLCCCNLYEIVIYYIRKTIFLFSRCAIWLLVIKNSGSC